MKVVIPCADEKDGDGDGDSGSNNNTNINTKRRRKINNNNFFSTSSRKFSLLITLVFIIICISLLVDLSTSFTIPHYYYNPSSSSTFTTTRRRLLTTTTTTSLLNAFSSTSLSVDEKQAEEFKFDDANVFESTTTSSTKKEKGTSQKASTTKEKIKKEQQVIGNSSSSSSSSEQQQQSSPSPNDDENSNKYYDQLEWSKDFGRRSKALSEKYENDPEYKIKLVPGDEGYFDVNENESAINTEEGEDDDDDYDLSNISIVRTKEEAQTVIKALNNASPDTMHACDTEVAFMNNLKKEGPVGNGYVTCVSIYSGPNFDYGISGGKKGTTLWIDNLDDSCGVLQEFKDWFENPSHLKIWHNYGFDRHVMWNEGINVKGFGGDTMHMARLQDTSRQKSMGSGGKGYSLEVLTEELLQRRKKPMKEIFGVPRLRKDGSEGKVVDVPPIDVLQRNPKFRNKFIIYSCYDAEGTWLLYEKLKELLENMSWIGSDNLFFYYNTYMREFGEVLTDMERRGIRVDTQFLKDAEDQARIDRQDALEVFRNWATKKIGPHGLLLNTASSVQLSTFLFGGTFNIKTKEKTERIRTFKVPRTDIPDDAWEEYKKAKEEEEEKLKNNSSNKNNQNDDDVLEKYNLDGMSNADLKAICKEFGLKVSGKKSDLVTRIRGHAIMQSKQTKKIIESDDLDDGIDDDGIDSFENMSEDDLKDACAVRSLKTSGKKPTLIKRLRDDHAYAMGLIVAATDNNSGSDDGDDNTSTISNGYQIINDFLDEAATKNKDIKESLDKILKSANAEPKYVNVTIKSLGMEPNKHTAGGAPSATADVLRALAGDPYAKPSPKYGTAYEFMGGGDEGHEACVALYNLEKIGSIDTTIDNFLTSLQTFADDQSRVHCSMNLNTETGRLSSRRPNLQNQPALEKDVYKIRQAFSSSPGNSLIVADYGQLELRLLASMTKCQSMIDAFLEGGDFHSRTAIDMFDYVQKAVDDGDVILEWDYSKGDPPKPLVKDEYASERRKAKTLNFSIAYGKTAHGLSQDWGVSREEAEEMLKKWYNARPEVEKWQKNTKAYARKHGITRTLMGRYRQLPDAQSKERKYVGHGERAAINTPVQGGAADVAMMAMIKINNSEKLKELGWILLLQIHDEVILEGPEESAKEAFEEVIKCMEEPWVYGLQKTAVPLLVDGSYDKKNWYDAK